MYRRRETCIHFCVCTFIQDKKGTYIEEEEETCIHFYVWTFIQDKKGRCIEEEEKRVLTFVYVLLFRTKKAHVYFFLKQNPQGQEAKDYVWELFSRTVFCFLRIKKQKNTFG